MFANSIPRGLGRCNLISHDSLKSYFNAMMRWSLRVDCKRPRPTLDLNTDNFQSQETNSTASEHQGWFKQLCLSWIILSVAAACVSCQELTSTLREGNRSCQQEEVIFNCIVRGPSSLSDLVLAWSSAEYILGSLQLSTAHGPEDVETSSMNGIITATARVTNIANVAGELVLESTLLITAVVNSTVTCLSGADGGTASIQFYISAVPGVPQMISAAEIFRDDICVILVIWAPPTNSDQSDITQYIVYIPSRNIRDISFSTLNTLTLSNCGDDIRIQVAAVNRVGCVGMNSSEVQPILLDIPTAPATSEGESATTTTEGGSASTSSQLGAGSIAGIIIAVLMGIVCICIYCGGIIVYIYRRFKQKDEERKGKVRANEEEEHIMAMVWSGLEKHEELKGNRSPMDCLIKLYITLQAPSQTYSVNGTQDKTSDSDIISAVGALCAVLKENEASDIREQVVNILVILKDEDPADMQRALDCLMKLIPVKMLNESNLQELRDKATETTLLEIALNSMIKKVLNLPPDTIKSFLLRLCDTLFEKLLKLSTEQETALKKFNIPSEYFESLTAKDLESVEEDVQVKMHVYEMPKGTEKGEFLVVDMLDVDHLQVRHRNVIEGRIEKSCQDFKCDEIAAEETANGLVHFINKCITKFINDKNIGEEPPVTFTPPFHDTSDKLIRWTREPEGASEGIKNIEVDVAAAVNDATGILLAMGNKEPDCRIGLSFRDRANVCYMEELDAGDCKIINMEWGAFDDDGRLEQWRTDYDGMGRIDSDGQPDDNPQLFEKMISEEQQGVVVCRALKDLHIKNQLFIGERDTELNFNEIGQRATKINFDEVEAFFKGSLGIIEGWDIETCKRQLKRRFKIEASDRDCVVIQRVCEAVSTRAARLAAAGIVALVKKINKMDGCTVAVDSFLHIQHPQFLKRIQIALKELEPGNKIKIKPIEYGSRQSADFATAMLKYCVGPPPSSSQGSSVPAGSQGQGDQQELISADEEVHSQHGDIELVTLA